MRQGILEGVDWSGTIERLENEFIFEHTEFYLRGIQKELCQIVGYIGLESMKEVDTEDKRFKSH